MRIRPGETRPDGTPWAQGPARVPPKNDMPPVGWGTRTQNWEKRIANWRARPAKERRSCTLIRQTVDPTMPLVIKDRELGEIRWSSGMGNWPNWSKTPCHKRGYWVDLRRGFGYSHDIKFIGDTIDDVHAFMDNYVTVAQHSALEMISAAENLREGVLNSVKTFETDVLAPKVLDILSKVRPSDDGLASDP